MKQKDLFLYLGILTVFFILLEISFFIQCNRIYFGDFLLVSHQLQIPTAILPGMVFFILMQLSLHLFFYLLAGIITLLIAKLLSLPSNQTILLGITVWSMGLLTVLLANQTYYPNSKFAELTQTVFSNETAAHIVLITLYAADALFISISIFSFIRIAMHQLKKKVFLQILVLSIMAASIFTVIRLKYITFNQNKLLAAPNIILIGIDAVRPDFLSYFGNERPTPFLDQFLTQSTVFSEAITPLARTFPSWTSILTGQYPKETNIRFNLAEQEAANLTDTLPAILKNHGYETIYATDESRFSNISKKYGFNRIISPPIGLNDFLLGTFNDFPLSNLLVNTLIGKYLFPYSYANRPVFFTYDPNSFLNLLQSKLHKERIKPLFLAVHFCLTHYPYLWASSRADKLNILERYQESIVRIDEQLKFFFDFLKAEHLLKHAIVVILSDHGEALELTGDRITEKDLFITTGKKPAAVPRFYPPSLDHEEVNQSIGHGTDVLSLTQYHTVLGFRLYGFDTFKTGNITGRVSLLDIKPTILELVHLPQAASSGYSLAKLITGQSTTLSEDHLFLESDFTPEAIRTVYPETRKVLLEGIQFFQINPLTTQLTVNSKMGKMIIHSKQYADIYKNWILALYPQSQKERMPILVNLLTGEWTNDLQSPFAKTSPAQQMLEKLRLFYGNEIGQV